MVHWVRNVIDGLDASSVVKLKVIFNRCRQDKMFDSQIEVFIEESLDTAASFTSDEALHKWLHANPGFLQLLVTYIDDATYGDVDDEEQSPRIGPQSGN